MRSKVARNLVPRTLHRYRAIVGSVLEALRSERRPTNPARWSLRDAQRIRQLVHDRHWDLSVLSDFGRASGNQMLREAGIPPTPAPTHVRWLSRSQVEAIVRETRDDPLLAFIAFLGLGQGLRRVEWQRMQMDDIDLDGRRLLVRGKGRSRPKLQWVALHPSFLATFERYAARRARLVEAARKRHPGAVLPNEVLIHRSANGLSSYSLAGLDLLVHRIERRLERAGSPAKLSSHMFRRSGATLLEEALLAAPGSAPDGIYRVLQGFLRHENLATTMKYLESNPARQARALVQFAESVRWPGQGARFEESRLPPRRASEDGRSPSPRRPHGPV